MLIFGGIIPYLLFDSSRRDWLECERCSFIFRPVKRLTKWDFITAILFVAVVAGGLVYVLLSFATR